MSFDLPEPRHKNSFAMARALVTYLDCPYKVRSAIKQEFQYAPTIKTIETMREKHLQSLKPKPYEPCRLTDAYYPIEAASSLEKANRLFLEKLEREREAMTLTR